MNNLNPHSEKKGTSAVRGWDVPLSAKEQRRLESEKRLQTNTENFKRYNLKPEPSTPDKTPKQITDEAESEKHINRLHEEHMALMLGKLSTLESQSEDRVSDGHQYNDADYARDFENFKAELRQALESESKSSHVEKPGIQNLVVIPQSDSPSPDRKKGSDALDSQGSKALDRQLNPQEIQDEFDVVNGSPSGQSSEALNRQFNSPEIIRALGTLNRWRGTLETKWVPDIMERAEQFSQLNNDQLKQRGIQDPDKYRKTSEKVLELYKNPEKVKNVPIIELTKTLRDYDSMLKKLQRADRRADGNIQRL